jgi:O-methyltransferase
MTVAAWSPSMCHGPSGRRGPDRGRLPQQMPSSEHHRQEGPPQERDGLPDELVHSDRRPDRRGQPQQPRRDTQPPSRPSRLGTVGKRWKNTSWPDDSNSIDVTGTGADHFCRHISYLINVGDEKGKILDNAVERTQPRQLLELGTYCGYSALRMARAMPREARLYSLLSSTPRMR